MTRGVLWRGGRAVTAALLAAGALLLLGAPLAANPANASAACPPGNGVTVVVDFGNLGGGVQTRCVAEAVTSGFDALTKAGFTYAGTTRFPGLLCRIDGKPADDPCYNAPPSNSYWAYWTAPQPGGAWIYSEQGAGNRVPPPGSVEGWAFSDGCDRKPGSGPCPSAATTTTGPPTTNTTTPATTRPASGSGGTPGGVTPNPGRAGPDTPSPDEPGGSSTTTAVGATGEASTSTSRSGERAPDPGEGDDDLAAGTIEASSPRPDGGGSSPVGAVVGGLVVLALGTAGAITARRRRSADGVDG